MLRILTSLALFHWAALFSLLTTLCVFAKPAQLLSIVAGTGGAKAYAALTPLEIGILAIGLALCSCLFLWSALTALASRSDTPLDDAVASTAFSAATVVLSAFAVLAVLLDLEIFAPVVAVSAGTLLASFFLVRAFEKSRGARTATLGRSAASVAATLARLSVRPKPQPSEAW